MGHINLSILKRRPRSVYAFVALGLVLTSATSVIVRASDASALSLTKTLVRFDRLTGGAATTGTICTTPASTATEASLQVVFPTGATASTTLANWATSTTNLAWPTGAVAWIGIGTATAVSGTTVTFPSGDLTAGTTYCFNWTNSTAYSNPSGANSNLTGTLTTQTSAPAAIDTAQYSTATVTSDQITVNATVPPSFSFSLSGNSDTFATPLSSASVSSSPTPRVATISTNAKAGWMVWAKDANTGLFSTAANNTIATTTPGTNSTLSAGTEGYNTGIVSNHTAGAGTITVATPFVGGATGKGGGLDTSLRTLATSSGTANGDTLTLTNNIAISPLTPAAGDYTDTITIVGAGSF